jgi:hypothetical protein
MVASTRSAAVNIELAERVLILIRAWAEELSIMHVGRQDPDAGFFIERYSSKRMRIKFPDVPVTPTPWVCPVGTSAGRSRFAGYGGAGRRGTTTTTKSPLPKSLNLGEVENTVNLFSNVLEKATDISEVRGDLCGDLAERCRQIAQHIDTLSATMEKDEEIARAIRVSEQLQKTLAGYDEAMATGELTNAPPIVVNGLSSDEDSVDEGYDVGAGSAYSTAVYYEGDREDKGSSRTDELMSRRREHSAGASSSAKDRRDRDSSRPKEKDDEASSREQRDRERRAGEKALARKEKEAKDGDKRKAEKRGTRKLAASSSKSTVKSEKSSAKGASKNDAGGEAASSAGKGAKASKQSAKADATENMLVDVADHADSKSTSSDASGEKKDDAFNLLAERYASNKSNKSSLTGTITPDVSVATLPPLPPASSAGMTSMPGGFVSGLAGMSLSQFGQSGASLPPTAPYTYQQPAPAQSRGQHQSQPQQAQQQPQLPYGSVMMMPNPLAMSMYGSYNPAMMQQQPYGALPSAYNTVNPGMYYNTVNPLAYSSVGSFMQTPDSAQSASPSSAAASSSNAALSGEPQSHPMSHMQPQMHQPQAQQPQAQQPQMQQQQVQQQQPQQQQPQQPQMQHQSRPQMQPQMQPQMTGQTMHAAAPPPPPPPPPLPEAYTTVTNAAAPPPSEPPPPSPSHGDASRGLSIASTRQPHAQNPSGFPEPSNGQEGRSRNPQDQTTMQQASAQQQQQPLSSLQPQYHDPFQSPQQAPQMPILPQQQPGFNPAMYGSVSGQPLMTNPSFLHSTAGAQPLPGQYPSVNGSMLNAVQYPSVSGYMMPMIPPAPLAGGMSANNSQASVYQNAMANAAAAYHAAATAYQSVQGQAPLVSGEQSGQQPNPSVMSADTPQ